MMHIHSKHVHFVGVPAQGTWKLIDELEDPELKDLASRLPQTILHSCANNTVKKYLGAFRRWKFWAIGHNLSPIPARPHKFALYLQFIGETKGSKSGLQCCVLGAPYCRSASSTFRLLC